MTQTARNGTGEEAPLGDLTPRELTRQEFGRRVYRLMIGRGWHQSELARRSGLKRAAISTYITGTSLPTAPALEKLAAALGVKPEELLPNALAEAIEAEVPSFEIKQSASSSSKAWLRVNRLVTMSTAVRIAELLQNDEAAD